MTDPDKPPFEFDYDTPTKHVIAIVVLTIAFALCMAGGVILAILLSTWVLT